MQSEIKSIINDAKRKWRINFYPFEYKAITTINVESPEVLTFQRSISGIFDKEGKEIMLNLCSEPFETYKLNEDLNALSSFINDFDNEYFRLFESKYPK